MSATSLLLLRGRTGEWECDRSGEEGIGKGEVAIGLVSTDGVSGEVILALSRGYVCQYLTWNVHSQLYLVKLVVFRPS